MPFGPFTSTTAFRYRDFRLLWLGMVVSVSGSMMQNAAILWHVYELTHSPVALGAVGLVKVLPIIGLSLLSGLAADRFDRKKVMMVAQLGMALCALVLGLLASHGIKSVWPIYVIAGLSSAFGAFDLPARQALLPSIVPEQDLPSAFSLNATMFQVGSIVGPVIAGAVIAQLGLHWAYWLNGLSFVAVLAALLSMRVQSTVSVEARPEINRDAILEGLRFVRRTPVILSSMLLDFFATFFSSATALLPIYAKDILHVGVTGYGWLYAAAAIGALVTGICLAFLTAIEKQGRVLFTSVILYGLGTVAFGVSPNFWMAFLALAITGAADTVSMIIRNTIRQLNTPDSVRGRMVSINMIFFMGGPQLGELEAGMVASWIGARLSVITGGLGCIVAVAWVAWRWPTLWRYDAELRAEKKESAHL